MSQRIAPVAAASRLEFAQYCYFLRPVAERALHRLIQKRKPGTVIEIGLGDGERSVRLIKSVLRFRPHGGRYYGIDPFEANADRPHISLKEAYLRLRRLQCEATFFPGHPAIVIPNVANQITDVELLVVGPEVDASDLVDTFPFWPRMLDKGGVVAQYDAAAEKYLVLSWDDVTERARQQTRQQRRAA